MRPPIGSADFVSEAKALSRKMFPSIRESPDYTAIVSDRHSCATDGLSRRCAPKAPNCVEINPAGEDLRRSRTAASRRP